MIYCFETKLFGLNIEVCGNFFAGESSSIDCEGSQPEFEIGQITHFGKRLEIEALPEDELVKIHLDAFRAMEDGRCS